MIKYFVIPIVFVSSIFGSGSYQHTPTSDRGQSRMHHMQQKHPDRLSVDQKHVYYMLSPLYQRMFLYGLDDDQREMVTVFEKRGENPYQAIDNILRRDRKRSDRTFDKKCSPCERTRKAGQQKKYIISQQEINSPDCCENATYQDEEYVMYEDTNSYSQDRQSEFVEKEPSHRDNRSNYAECNGCSSCGKSHCSEKRKKPRKQSALIKRCKAYFSKTENKENQKRSSYSGDSNRKKHKYNETSKKRCHGCGK